MKPIIKFLLIGLIVSGIVLIGLFSYLAGRSAAPTKSAVNSTVNTTVTKNVNAVSKSNKNINTNTNTIEAVTSIVDVGVTWLDEPQLLENLNLFDNSADYQDIDQYYKVADLADGGEVIYFTRTEMGTAVNRFRKDVSDNYYLLANHSDEYYVENKDLLIDGVTVDTTTIYKSLQYPTELVVAYTTLTQQWLPFSFNDLFITEDDDPATPFTLLDDTAYGPVYVDTEAVVTTIANGSIESKSYVLKLADGSVVRYLAKKDFLADDGSLIADFTKGWTGLAQQQFFVGMVASGCGVLGGDQSIVDMTPEALNAVGATETGDTLYTITDPDNTVLLNAYETYQFGRNYEGSTETVLSYEEFVDRTPIVIWQDGLENYLVLMDNAFAPLVECGKPMIYLYPTQPTPVSVQVGANVTKSEPAYNGGWNVTAQPSGTSLYWEGTGWGTYPQITTGKVVASATVEQTIRADLTSLGLNETEIADFLEFWLPRMPKTPYARLSWLNTEQMNQLAPLSVKPRPDTVIRVFLDFAGQTTAQTSLVSQTLTALPRNGFTVIEWGGLLLGQ